MSTAEAPVLARRRRLWRGEDTGSSTLTMPPRAGADRRFPSRFDHSISVSMRRSWVMTPVATIQSPGFRRELRPPAIPKLTIAGAPANTAFLIACARNSTLPPHANTLTPGARAILASALSPVTTINNHPRGLFGRSPNRIHPNPADNANDPHSCIPRCFPRKVLTSKNLSGTEQPVVEHDRCAHFEIADQP